MPMHWAQTTTKVQKNKIKSKPRHSVSTYKGTYYTDRKIKANHDQTSGFRCQFVRDVENIDTWRTIPRISNQKNSKPWEI